MLQRPGSSWGFGALLKDTSVVVLKEERALVIHSPTNNQVQSLPDLRFEPTTFGLRVRLSNIRPRHLLKQCGYCGNLGYIKFIYLFIHSFIHLYLVWVRSGYFSIHFNLPYDFNVPLWPKIYRQHKLTSQSFICVCLLVATVDKGCSGMFCGNPPDFSVSVSLITFSCAGVCGLLSWHHRFRDETRAACKASAYF